MKTALVNRERMQWRRREREKKVRKEYWAGWRNAPRIVKEQQKEEEVERPGKRCQAQSDTADGGECRGRQAGSNSLTTGRGALPCCSLGSLYQCTGHFITRHHWLLISQIVCRACNRKLCRLCSQSLFLGAQNKNDGGCNSVSERRKGGRCCFWYKIIQCRFS